MKHLQIIAVAVFVFFAGTFAYAQNPKFDISGIWRSNDPGTAQNFQDGHEVKGIYVNKGFSHFFTGTYVTPTTIKGIQYRRNRANGCLTIMFITFNVQSQDSMTFDWIAQDSNCDLREGQKGSGRTQRDNKLEESTWY
ncbi:MAG: hypothetical protein Q8P56_04995 [Candidatus Uhrbacteria bacterium]|nr:hypothetical protein [Candidatus Uhrbacteria bacterium]